MSSAKRHCRKDESDIGGDGKMYAGWLSTAKNILAEALSIACYLWNRCPTKAVQGNNPYEALYGEKPAVGHLRAFGCSAYSHIPKDERQKLDDKSHKCIFLGYSHNRKGHWLYDESKCKVIHSWDIRFDKLSHGTEEETPPANGNAASEPVILESAPSENECEGSPRNEMETCISLHQLLNPLSRKSKKFAAGNEKNAIKAKECQSKVIDTNF